MNTEWYTMTARLGVPAVSGAILNTRTHTQRPSTHCTGYLYNTKPNLDSHFVTNTITSTTIHLSRCTITVNLLSLG